VEAARIQPSVAGVNGADFLNAIKAYSLGRRRSNNFAFSKDKPETFQSGGDPRIVMG